MHYYDIAAKLGDSRGYLNLAHINESLLKDFEEAIRNYEKAAELGSEIAKNILKLKGMTFIPSIKKNLMNPQSNFSKILNNNNNSQFMMDENTQNSFALNQSKPNINKVKVPPLPLISSYVSSGIPKQLIQKQIDFDYKNNLENSEKNKTNNKLFEEDHKKIPFGRDFENKKPEKKIPVKKKENIIPDIKGFDDSGSMIMLN